MHSGPCRENHSGALSAWHSSLRKLRKEKTHKKTRLSKREAPLQSQAWASGHWEAGKQDQCWRNLEVYSQRPLPLRVTWRMLGSVVSYVQSF